MASETSDDRALLIDFLRDEVSPEQRREVLHRLRSDEAFRRLRDDLANTFEAMDLIPQAEPPQDMVAATLERIQQVRRTESLLAREESRRSAVRPTFSLRELSAAAAAVFIMAAVLIPSVRQARRLAVIGQCASNVGQIGSGMLAYANANDDSLPGADSLHDRWLPGGGQEAFSNSTALYKLIRSGYVSSAVFSCPAGGSETFVAMADMTDFPAGKFVGYSYQHALGRHPIRRSDPELVSRAEKMAILADGTPVFVDGRFRPERIHSLASENHGGAGQNVLYLDMHVGWAEQPNVGVDDNNIFLVEGITEYTGSERPAGATDTFLLPTFSPPGPVAP